MPDAHEAAKKADLLNQWRAILKVNYWPIFGIARRILEVISAPNSEALLPAAAHLTASMLSGAHPTIKYKQSSILTVAYVRSGPNQPC